MRSILYHHYHFFSLSEQNMLSEATNPTPCGRLFVSIMCTAILYLLGFNILKDP